MTALYGNPACAKCGATNPIGTACICGPNKWIIAPPVTEGMPADLFNRACVFCWGNEYSYIAADALHILHRNIRFFRSNKKHIPVGIAKDLAAAVREEIARGEALLKELESCG